jgi:hypothetical protein
MTRMSGWYAAQSAGLLGVCERHLTINGSLHLSPRPITNGGNCHYGVAYSPISFDAAANKD